MAKTDKQRVADDLLDVAIRRCAEAYFVDDAKPREGTIFMSEWIVVVCHTDLDDPESDSMYGVLMPNGSIPMHHAVGLLTAGTHQLLNPDSWDNDDKQ
jgi:hypothetical protein